MGEGRKIPCTFAGFALSKTVNGVLRLDLHEYRFKTKALPEDASYENLAYIRMKLRTKV